jgi:hypothetical protein
MADPLPTYSPDVVNVDAIAATIRQIESGNNYTIKNNTSSASGAYQFLDTTWQGLTARYAAKVPSGRMYNRAADAPPAIQDAIAQAYIVDILASNNNNVAAVPATWYVGSLGYANQHADTVPAGNSLTPRQYVDKWLKTFNSVSGQSPGTGITPGSVIGGIPAGLGAAGQAAADHLNPLSSIGDLIGALGRTVFSGEWWKWVGIGALGLMLIGFAFMGSKTGQTVIQTGTEAATTAAKAAAASA